MINCIFIADALGLCRRDVILTDGFEHRRARGTGHQSRKADTNGKCRQDQALQAVFVAAGGEPAELQREREHQQQAQPELRHGNEQQGSEHTSCVSPGILVNGRVDAQWNGNDDGNHNSQERKLHGVRKQFHIGFENVLLGNVGGAHAAFAEIDHIAGVAD